MNPTSTKADRPTGRGPWRRRLAFCGMIGLIGAVWVGPVAAQVRVAGSDSLGVEFTRGLIELGSRARLELRVALDGSLPAHARLLAGTAELGFLLQGPESAPLPEGFTGLPWAYWAVAVVVPAGHPLGAVSIRQLESGFGPLAATSVRRWGELGLIDPVWAERNVSFHVPDPASGLAHDLFRHVVLKNRSFREGIIFHAQPGDLLRSLPANGLGFVPWSALAVGGSAVRVMPITVAAGGPAHGPDAIALHRGDYPLRLPLRLVFRSANAAQLRPLLQALLAEEGAALATAAGFVPLPPDVRREVAVELAKEPGRQISASEK